MSDLRRQYEIDNHLGRFGKALKGLYALQQYDDLKLYAIKHSLYKDALELYKYEPELHRDMYQLYADYLYDQNNYKEAAIGESYHYPSAYSVRMKVIPNYFPSLRIPRPLRPSLQVLQPRAHVARMPLLRIPHPIV